METIHYLRALGRSWWLIVITLIAGGAGGFFIYHTTTPEYRSTVRLVVSGAGSGSASDELTARVLSTERAQALSQVAGTAPASVAAKIAAGYPTANPSVTSTSQTSGPFFTIEVTDTDAARAKAIADKFAATLPETIARLEGRNDIRIKVANLAPASLPGAPFSPNRTRDVGLGMAVGLILGIAIALLRESLNRSVREGDELQQLTGLSVLGTIPRDLPKRPLPAATDPRSARAEAYRQVRTALLSASPLRPLTVVVTSAALGEGKTSVATNLASVFSRAGHRVALVDADLRRPMVARFFGLEPPAGLADVLTGRVSLDEAMTILDDGRLAVLTAGRIPADPSEALGSAAMDRVMAQLHAEYEFVFIDTPPVLPVTDALVLAPNVDGIVLVARLGHTTRERVKHATDAIARVNVTVLGVVPNQAGKGSDRDYRYTYRYKGSRRNEEDAPPPIPDSEHPPPPPPAVPPSVEPSVAPSGAHSAEEPVPPTEGLVEVGMDSLGWGFATDDPPQRPTRAPQPGRRRATHR